MRELFDLMRRGERGHRTRRNGAKRGEAPQREQTQAEMRADFASDLAILKARAGMLGLFLTMHRMDFPLRMVGFEISAEACWRYEAATARRARRRRDDPLETA